MANRERREESRLQGPIPVYVRGKTETGQVFRTHTLIDNVSQGGLYLQLPYTVLPGSGLFAYTKLPSGARLAARGCVLRTESKSHGLSGVAVSFKCTRMFANIG